MRQPSIIVTIVALFALFQQHNAQATTKYLQNSYSYPDKEVMYNNYALKQGIFVYAVCNKDGPITEKICTIIQHKFPYDKVAHSCDVTLRVKHPENFNLTDRIRVHAFGQENAILLWGEVGSSSKLNLMAIQLNSCKKKMVELDDPEQTIYNQQIHAHKILTYDNDFDIFFESIASINDVTETQVGLRIDFDSEPQPIRNMLRNKNGDYVRFISPIATRSPDKGHVYCVIGKNGSETVTLVKPDGTKKILMGQEKHGTSISAYFDVISICVSIAFDSNTTCTQFDENGEVKFKIMLDHDDKQAIWPIALHTTPGGGFLLMTRTFEKFAGEVNFDKISGFNVIRFDSNGINKGRLCLNDFVEVKKTMPMISMWENGDGYCATLVSRMMDGNDIEIAVGCFTENDFSV